MNIRQIARDVETILTNAHIPNYNKPDRRSIIESIVDTSYRSGPGRLLYDIHSDRDQLAAELTGESDEIVRGWPECVCTGCGCTNLATTTDDGGVPVCSECVDYAVDDNGDVVCARTDSDKLETVTECCGAGGQTRSYVRLLPPDEPETDDDGQYALWWETVGDDTHLVARYATLDAAQQALAAKDWPAPGDHTNYLCGYGVREMVNDEWEQIAE